MVKIESQIRTKTIKRETKKKQKRLKKKVKQTPK